MDTRTFKPRPYAELREWFMQAKQRKREWEAFAQVKLAEMEREMKESRARFAAIHDELGE